MCEQALAKAGLRANIVIDCSHGNSLKQHEVQPLVLTNIVRQIRDGNTSIVGVMLESNLEAGRQGHPRGPQPAAPRRLGHGRVHRLEDHGDSFA